MDYRVWIKDKDWRRFDEKVLSEIDEAVRFGEKYGIHVCMNFHRAPGYTVATPPEEKSVWTDPEALEVCSLHWRTFAKRYKGVSSDLVSFNLFNEPGAVRSLLPQCVAAHKHVIAEIRKEDPERLIICDGYEWGGEPFFDLVDQKIAQATRGYAPMEMSHYKASWVNSEGFPEPTWPMRSGNGIFFAPNKGGIEPGLKGPMVVTGPFPKKTKLRFRVGTVSSATSFAVRADGETIFTYHFKPGPGEGEWKKVVYREEWKTYQNIYDRDYETFIPAGTQKLELQSSGGDWLTLTELGLQAENADHETMVRLIASWNREPTQFQYGETGLTGGEVKDKAWLKKRTEPWRELQKRGCGVMVGEFGAFSPSPHDATLRWMADMLANWKEAGWGFALWNFRGSFGIMDSNRADVDYEDFHGHKLDRQMLKLLQDN